MLKRNILLAFSRVFATLTGTAMADTYQNPINGKSYTTPGKWKTYSPQRSISANNEKVSLVGITLLTAQAEMEQSTTAQELAAFIDKVEVEAKTVFKDSKESSLIMLQFECAQLSQEIKIAYQGTPDETELQHLYKAVLALEHISVRQKPITFQVQIRVAP